MATDVHSMTDDRLRERVIEAVTPCHDHHPEQSERACLRDRRNVISARLDEYAREQQEVGAVAALTELVHTGACVPSVLCLRCRALAAHTATLDEIRRSG